jgi:hypothetical protein
MTVLVIARAQPVLDRVLAQLAKAGIDAAGTLSDDEAIGRMDAGGVTALVIGGGVEAPSKQRLRATADAKSARIVEGALQGRDPETYVREVLLPALR